MIASIRTLAGVLALCLSVTAQGETKLPTPPEVWKDYSPDKGDFREEIIKQETKDGIYYKDSYVSAYINGEEVRVYCKYAVKAGAKIAPGLMNVQRIRIARITYATTMT